jgi:midasin (ATPase involved in ribosome maturation)
MFLLNMLNYNNNNDKNNSNNNSCFPHLNNIFTVVDYRNTFNKNIDKKVSNFCSHVSDLICTIKLFTRKMTPVLDKANLPTRFHGAKYGSRRLVTGLIL